MTQHLPEQPDAASQEVLFNVPLHSRRQVLAVMASSEPLDLASVKAVIHELWCADVQSRDMAHQTFTRYWQLIEGFLAYAHAHGCSTLDEALHVYDPWVNAMGSSRTGKLIPPGLSVRHLRSCAVRALYRSARFLGLAEGHPPYVPGNTEVTRSGRPLNEVEAELLRHAVGSQPTSRLPAAVALGLSGAGTGDIGNVLIRDVDLNDGVIHLRGGTRTQARTVAIPGEWEFRTLALRVGKMSKRRNSLDTGLIVTRSGSEASRQSGAAIAITQATDTAGLRQEPDIKPASLQRWAATVAFETAGNIADAARLLGTASLDTASQAIDWNWAITPAERRPPRPDYRPRALP
jgi:hypothetical protein